MAFKMEGASPPVFEQIFRNARFAQGGNALFEGKVAGSPRPQVSPSDSHGTDGTLNEVDD